MEDRFVEIYRAKIHRPEADKLLAWLGKMDFFTVPASTRQSLSGPEGLVKHSMHVFETEGTV